MFEKMAEFQTGPLLTSLYTSICLFHDGYLKLIKQLQAPSCKHQKAAFGDINLVL